jgi:WD40 repeat protein
MSGITELHQIDLHCGHTTKPRWSPDGRFLAIPSKSGSIPIFDLDSRQVVQRLGPHSGEVTAVGWDRKAEFIMTGSLDRSVGLWEVKSGRRAPFTVSGHREPVHSVEWTDEEAYAMTCSSDRVRALDGCCLLAGWTEAMEDTANTYTGFTEASCSCRTTFLLGIAAENGALLLLANLVSGDLLDSVRMEDPVRSLAWSPAELLLAVGTGQRILVFRATHEGFDGPARELTSLAPHVHALSFSSDGTLLASRDAQGLKIWDVENATLTVALHENIRADLTSGIAFHPSIPLLAAAGPDGGAFRILEVQS